MSRTFSWLLTFTNSLWATFALRSWESAILARIGSYTVWVDLLSLSLLRCSWPSLLSSSGNSSKFAKNVVPWLNFLVCFCQVFFKSWWPIQRHEGFLCVITVSKVYLYPQKNVWKSRSCILTSYTHQQQIRVLPKLVIQYFQAYQYT